MNKIFYDVFSGGGGAATGAKAAGLDPRFGLELMPDIAEYYNRNVGHHCVVANILGLDFTSLEVPWWFHGSPPCTTASQANQDAKETELDRDLARALCRAIHDLRPPWFSLENVGNYRNYQSFQFILKALKDEGYAIVYRVLDAADYGVPQNRKRLILVASRVGRPVLPVPTHINPAKLPNDSQLSLLSLPLPWVGWYEAVKHRIPEFTDTEWADWQIPRLPADVRNSFLVGSGNNSFADASPGRGVRHAQEPAHTITSSTRGKMTAFLMHGGNSGANGDRYRFDNEPSFTVTASNRVVWRSCLVSGCDATTRRDEQSSFKVCASFGDKGTVPRAGIEGRVVKLSMGALADLQSFPKTYQLPTAKTLASKIIGNAVPPLLMQRVIEANL